MAVSDKSDKNETVSRFRWVRNPGQKGELLFTFDGAQIFNLFRDYPDRLSQDQKEQFDAENPYWADFFKDRT